MPCGAFWGACRPQTPAANKGKFRRLSTTAAHFRLATSAHFGFALARA